VCVCLICVRITKNCHQSVMISTTTGFVFKSPMHRMVLYIEYHQTKTKIMTLVSLRAGHFDGCKDDSARLFWPSPGKLFFKKFSSKSFAGLWKPVSRVVTQCFYWPTTSGEELRDNPNNGCEGDYNRSGPIWPLLTILFVIENLFACSQKVRTTCIW